MNALDAALDKVGLAIDDLFLAADSLMDRVIGKISVKIRNGEVTLDGNIKSIRVNGRRLRIPEDVLRGKNQ